MGNGTESKQIEMKSCNIEQERTKERRKLFVSMIVCLNYSYIPLGHMVSDTNSMGTMNGDS